MKSQLFIAFFIGIVIVGCQKDNQQMTPGINKTSDQNSGVSSTTNTDMHSDLRYSTLGHGSSSTTGSEFISILDADAMISSYLYSIHAETSDSDVRSYSVDADMLRAYLADTSVKKVKVIFAHTLDYIRGGHMGQYAGYKPGALTIIMAGYDATGKYIFHDGKVLDHAVPCPYECPSGQAANSLLY